VTAKNRDEAVSYVSHPLNAYQLIKRWSQLNHAMLNTAQYKGTASSYLGTLTRFDKIAIQRFSSIWQLDKEAFGLSIVH